MLAGAEEDRDFRDIEERLTVLKDSWSTLQEEAANRLHRLEDASEAQQYYLDAGEAEAWISEQELYMVTDEKPKVRLRSTQLTNKHPIRALIPLRDSQGAKVASGNMDPFAKEAVPAYARNSPNGQLSGGVQMG